MHVDIIDDIEELRCQEENWRSVHQADPDGQYFLSWTWMVNWLDLIDDQWLVLAVKPEADAQSYVAYFPVQLWSQFDVDRGFFNTIRMGGSYYAGYTGFLCDPAYDESAIPALAVALRRLNWMAISVDRVAVSQPRLDLFLDAFSSTEFVTQLAESRSEDGKTDFTIFPYVALPDDWETYLKGHLGRTTRKHARRCMKQIDNGELRVTHATAETIERDLDILLGLWETMFAPIKTEGATRLEIEHHRTMLRACFAAGEVFLPILWQGDKPIGARARLLDEKTGSVICLVGARDLSVQRPPPGFIIHLYSIRWAIENGFKTYDLQLGNYDYKYDYGPEERRIVNRSIKTKSQQNLRGKIEPRSVPFVFAMAQRFAAGGQASQAAKGCRQILEVDPDHTGAGELLKAIEAASRPADDPVAEARRLAQQGAFGEAEDLLSKILQGDPKNFDARYALGLTYLQQGDNKNAEQHLRRAITLNGKVASAYYNYGNALAALGRHAKALKSYKKAISLRAGYPQAHNACGEALVALGRRAEALKSFDQALALQPGFNTARQNRDTLTATRRS